MDQLSEEELDFLINHPPNAVFEADLLTRYFEEPIQDYIKRFVRDIHLLQTNLNIIQTRRDKNVCPYCCAFKDSVKKLHQVIESIEKLEERINKK